jgi:hypothetical protein
LCEIHLFIGLYILHMNTMHWKHVWHMDKCIGRWIMSLWFNECYDLNPGLMTNARGMERCGLKVQPGNHIHILGSARECEGMNPHTPKWAPILGVGILMDFRIFKEWFEGSKLIRLKSSWNINVKNEVALSIWKLTTKVMDERKV